MLSYRHAFHAGNYADVLKHIVLSKCIQYLLKKDAPITYIDSHAGAGCYSLANTMAQKTEEYKEGIQRIDEALLRTIDNEYAELIQTYSDKQQYPGSPEIAKKTLRKKDLLHLFELHPTDFHLLQSHFSTERNVIPHNTNGYTNFLPLLPTKGRRALILIDPSYELKTEYQQLVNTLSDAYKRMPNAVFLIWYPVVNRITVEKTIQKIRDNNIKDVWRYELGLQDDTEGYGMTSSGMLVINGPWTLAKNMESILPKLANSFGSQSVWKSGRVCDE